MADNTALRAQIRAAADVGRRAARQAFMKVDLSGINVPHGYCHCGCGKKTNPWTKTSVALGAVRGDPRHFVAGHAQRLLLKSVTERLVAGFDKRDDDDGCWLWRGYSISGVPRLMVGGKHLSIRRLMYEEFIGPLEPADDIQLACGERRCGRPDHLICIPAIVRPRPSPTDLAWTAGFVDGEGYVGITWKSHDHRVASAVVSIANTNVDALRAIQEWFGGFLQIRPIRKLRGPRMTRPCGMLVLTNRKARDILLAIRPYLRVKGGQADLVLQFDGMQRFRGGTRALHIPQSIIEERRRLWQAISDLNHGREVPC